MPTITVCCTVMMTTMMSVTHKIYDFKLEEAALELFFNLKVHYINAFKNINQS